MPTWTRLISGLADAVKTIRKEEMRSQTYTRQFITILVALLSIITVMTSAGAAPDTDQLCRPSSPSAVGQADLHPPFLR